MKSLDPFNNAFKDTVPNTQGNSVRGVVAPSSTARAEGRTAAEDWKALVLKNPIENEAPTEVTFGDYMRTSKLLLETSKILYGTERILPGEKDRLQKMKEKLEGRQRDLEKILKRKNIPLPSPMQIMNYNPNESE